MEIPLMPSPLNVTTGLRKVNTINVRTGPPSLEPV